MSVISEARGAKAKNTTVNNLKACEVALSVFTAVGLNSD
jgi:hypothetical protein